MSVLVEGWVPVGVYDDVNLMLQYGGGDVVTLEPINPDVPAYIPVYKVGANPIECRMALLAAGENLTIDTGEQGIGGLEDAAVVHDTGYDVYVLVKDDLSAIGAIACVHATALTPPAGWGGIYASKPLRYFCCNTYDGAANYDRITPFVETAPRETFYCAPGSSVDFFELTSVPRAPVLLKTGNMDRKAQFPGTARKVFVEVKAIQNEEAVVALSLFLNDGATAVYTLPNLSTTVAGCCESKETLMMVPCHGAAAMDATDLLQAWSGGDDLTLVCYALGYQL